MKSRIAEVWSDPVFGFSLFVSAVARLPTL